MQRALLSIRKKYHTTGTRASFVAGKATGRIIEAVINYIWEDWTGLDDDYCIIGFDLLEGGK